MFELEKNETGNLACIKVIGVGGGGGPHAAVPGDHRKQRPHDKGQGGGQPQAGDDGQRHRQRRHEYRQHHVLAAQIGHGAASDEAPDLGDAGVGDRHPADIHPLEQGEGDGCHRRKDQADLHKR